jgi:hypothetical protein
VYLAKLSAPFCLQIPAKCTALPYWERAQVRFRQAIGNSTEWDLLLKNVDQICEFAKLAEHGKFTNVIPIKARAATATTDSL